MHRNPYVLVKAYTNKRLDLGNTILPHNILTNPIPNYEYNKYLNRDAISGSNELNSYINNMNNNISNNNMNVRNRNGNDNSNNSLKIVANNIIG